MLKLLLGLSRNGRVAKIDMRLNCLFWLTVCHRPANEYMKNRIFELRRKMEK